ncbi:MAG: hypothetical protein IJP13_08530 [Lachnospiraceae bacterium]|nr:hypothetical protein [Lachnospiraceae bacterium]
MSEAIIIDIVGHLIILAGVFLFILVHKEPDELSDKEQEQYLKEHDKKERNKGCTKFLENLIQRKK